MILSTALTVGIVSLKKLFLIIKKHDKKDAVLSVDCKFQSFSILSDEITLLGEFSNNEMNKKQGYQVNQHHWFRVLPNDHYKKRTIINCTYHRNLKTEEKKKS